MNILTNAHVSMPQMIYGTAWKKERTADLVEDAVKEGFRGIDTACQPKHYNEAEVGEALARLAREGFKRDDLFLQTKFTPIDGQDPLRLPYDKSADLATQVAQSFAASQQNLGVQTVDSLVLHSPLYPRTRLMTAWKAMEAIHKKGGARQLGISNCYDLGTLKALYNEAEIKPAVIQNRFYRETGFDHDLRAWSDAKKIIYQSFWTLTANPEILAHPIVQSMAAHRNMKPAQIFFRFLTELGIAPLTGTSSGQHMREDLAIFAFKLQSSEIDRLKSLIELSRKQTAVQDLS